MRYIIICFLITVVTGCSTTQQTGPSTEPYGQTTGIILTVNDSPDKAFTNLVNYFSQRGFKFERIDRYQHYLRTEFKTMDELMYTYSVEAVIPPKDSTVVVFRGEAIGPYIQSSAPIKKRMGNLNNNLWDRFHETVIHFPHKKVFYSSE